VPWKLRTNGAKKFDFNVPAPTAGVLHDDARLTSVTRLTSVCRVYRAYIKNREAEEE